MTAFLYTNAVEVAEHWLPELDRNNPLRPGGIVPLVSFGSEWRSDVDGRMDKHTTALHRLRAHMPAAVMVKFVDQQVGDTYASWLSTGHWKRLAYDIDRVLRLCEDIPGFGRLLVLDFEAYLPEHGGLYTERDGGTVETTLAIAMRPLFEALAESGVRPLILPVPLKYPAVTLAATALRGLRPILADEATYKAPFHAAYWQHAERNGALCAALGLDYMPWFYAAALRLPDFGEQLAKRDIRNYGLFPRGVDNGQDFWQRDWATRPIVPVEA